MGKTWAAIAVALIGALIAWFVPGNARKTQADLPKPAAAKRAAATVNLGLREVERVLSFDIARAHVIADRVAED